ncbi:MULTISPECIES: Uma2 family endonuclease [Cyanophyceae]|uniref:Uma2 family endonuclease n=1 Tax=Cyanophyceae TaxID=3028117 RepID=UPI001683C77D|nr:MULTISPECIES: Uma2 family endonuclease [unclassified Phormidium]MBD1918072.1 Uma2 family endonuclease [Phormidium sp. FACHB-77]MBD2030105.1 Uma2 family endonuclease [Phormidium sp. FACHB-322]MBD2051524.1 Uma2 family endonuclease [Leptolyngbya sp. FACHB-60]
MAQAQPQLKTFSDFLAYAQEVEGYYELTNGELVEMPPESDENLYRAMRLYEALKSVVDMRQIRLQGLAIAMPGQPKNRYPDLTVLRPEHPEQMRELGQAAITLEMAPPLLVVEVVSPGAENRRRDYLEKRNQYEWRGIGEYWILDPAVGRVTVLSLTPQGYSEATFEGESVVESFTFPDWAMTAEAMLAVT